MLNINRILTNERTMRACTSLSIDGFEKLCEKFNQAIYDIQQQQYKKGIKNKTRQRKIGGGAKGRLATIELKLFFVLIYFKCYPTFNILGILFGLDRSNTKRDIDNLTPVLEKALGKALTLPKRKISTLKEFFELIPGAKDLFIDRTERSI